MTPLGVALVGLSLVSFGALVPVPEFYPFGENDQLLETGDDFNAEVELSTPIKFFSRFFDTIYVHTNGLITFDVPIVGFENIEFPLPYSIIAPLYSNVDTTASGQISYRETTEPLLLERSSENVNRLFPHLPTKYQASSLFIVTWEAVGYYRAGADKVNTFQLVISTNGEDTFIEIIYADGGIQWIQGKGDNSMPQVRAQAGIVTPEGIYISLKGSGTDQVSYLDRLSNTGEPGLFMYRVGQVDPLSNAEGPHVDTSDIEDGKPKTCAEGFSGCHSNARCIDESTGVCCRCLDGYFGNGIFCLSRDLPQRLNGKVNVSLNGVKSNNLDFQGYIVIKDGRAYTAVDKPPAEIGTEMQFVNILETVVGWLFAVPTGNTKNGFELTGGVLNHTATITFDSNHRVRLNQMYQGIDAYDCIKAEVDISGTTPRVPRDAALSLTDYQQQYTRTQPGVFRSTSKQEFTLETGEKIQASIDQTITFEETCDTDQETSLQKLTSSRNYITFKSNEPVLRFAAFHKVSSTTGEEDPCIEGKIQCVANSSCLVQEDSFKCVCNPGFQAEYTGSSEEFGCIDINECNEGTDSCHHHAICVNEIGSFSCQCNSGYSGDGKHCEAMTAATVPPNVICTEIGNMSTCFCEPGFQAIVDGSDLGYICEDMNECENGYSPCNEYADCINMEGGFSCQCKSGYQGDGYICSIESDDCRTMRCPEGSVCRDTRDGPSCECPPGYDGNPPHCTRIPDVEGQQCSAIECPEGSECQQTSVGATCVCLPNFLGTPPHCIPQSDECTMDDDCPSDAHCTYNHTNGVYMCTCDPGFSRSGTVCINSSSRASGGRLADQVLRTCHQGTCWCPPDYEDNGQVCVRAQSAAVPEVPPISGSCSVSNNCHNNAQCIYDSLTQNHRCMCKSGYEGDGIEYCDPLEISCKEADICHINATCIYDERSDIHTCICKEGTEGDGFVCVSIESCYSDDVCGANAHCEYVEELERNECRCNGDAVRGPSGTCEPEYLDRTCKEQCDEFAYCAEIRGQMECVCSDGYIGDGVTCEKREPGCDELRNCGSNADCLFDTSKLGYRCQCRPGYQGDGITCEEIITCQQDRSMCSPDANCDYSSGRFTCKCKPGFFGNGTVCKEAMKQNESFLLLNKGNSILQIPFVPTPQDRGKPVYLEVDQVAVGIAVDCVEGKVYWSDIAKKKIKRAKFDGTDVEDFLIDVESAEGMAIDWMERRIYWTDSANDSISSANLDTKEVQQIVTQDLVNPRGIAVHPWRRKIFWSDWNRNSPKIEWANYDGTGREVLLRSPGINLPNSLTIDWDRDELCWADAGTKNIGCVNIDRRVPRIVVDKCKYPFGLAITSDKYYWSDWNTLKVESAPRDTGAPITSIPLPLGGDDKLYGLVAVSSCPS